MKQLGITVTVCVFVFDSAASPPQALLLLGTVCVVWMGVKLGCRVNSSLVRFGTLQERKRIGDFVSHSIFMQPDNILKMEFGMTARREASC